jgi:hypothetical protein
MFGSLVVVFPTPHKGGALILRRNDEEWTFDFAKELSSAPQPSVSYIAFYSDVEHEVMPLSSGYRVTLTYNLHFPSEAPGPAGITRNPSPQHILIKTALENLLADPKFLPNGGNLGFGLDHQYAIERKEGELKDIIGYLKGNDAVILHACRELSLKAELKLVYEDERDYRRVWPDNLVLMDRVAKLPEDQVEDGLSEALCKLGGKRIKSTGLAPREPSWDLTNTNWEDSKESAVDIWWMSELTPFTMVETPYVRYGNEAHLAFSYGNLCLVVGFGAAGNRASV